MGLILWLKLEKCYILKTLPTKFCPILPLVLRKFTKGIRNHLLRYIKMVVTLLANCVIPQCGTFQTSKNKSCIIWRERIWSRSQGTDYVHWHPFFSNWVLRLCIQRIRFRFHSIEETIIGIRRRNLWAIWFITHQDILITPITKNCEYNINDILVQGKRRKLQRDRPWPFRHHSNQKHFDFKAKTISHSGIGYSFLFTQTFTPDNQLEFGALLDNIIN